MFSKNCVYLATNPVGELLEDTRASHFETEEVVVLLGGWREVLELELGVESLGPDWSSPDTAGVEGHSFSFHSFWVSKQFFLEHIYTPNPPP